MRKKLLGIITALVALAASLGTVTQAVALPEAPPPVQPVTGIPDPCAPTHPWPGDDVDMDAIKAGLTEHFGFKLEGSKWTDAHRESIKILWETLDAVSCTPYVATLQGKVSAQVGLNATSISGYAWGDWSLTRTNFVSLDFTKFQQALDSGDKGRIARLVVHELAHVLNTDRYESPGYWQTFEKLYNSQGAFSEYGAGRVTETFADVVGYYVARCVDGNPYDSGKFSAYYEYTKQHVFDGKEFGPAPGEPVDCSAPGAAQTGDVSPSSWIVAVSGE